jgi:hypothetical protein
MDGWSDGWLDDSRSACITAKVKYRKHETALLKCVDTSIVTFITRRKKGSSHLRKILNASIPPGIPKVC